MDSQKKLYAREQLFHDSEECSDQDDGDKKKFKCMPKIKFRKKKSAIFDSETSHISDESHSDPYSENTSRKTCEDQHKDQQKLIIKPESFCTRKTSVKSEQSDDETESEYSMDESEYSENSSDDDSSEESSDEDYDWVYLVRKNYIKLEVLRRANKLKRNAILHRADNELIHCLSLCVKQMLQGKFVLSDVQLQRLKVYKHTLRKLKTPHLKCVDKKAIIIQNDGFIPPLLTAVFTSIMTSNIKKR